MVDFFCKLKFSLEHVKNVKGFRFIQVFYKISKILCFFRPFMRNLSNSWFFHDFPGEVVRISIAI